MNGWHLRVPALCSPVFLIVLVSSCNYYGGSWMTERCEKQVALAAPLAAGLSFVAETRDGHITVEGLETTECRVNATVVTHARTMEEAQELADRIEVRLESSASGVEVVIDRPSVIRNAGYSVSLSVQVPRQTNLTLVTSDGKVQVANIVGRVDARTSDGSIGLENVEGDSRLRTSDGSIACTHVRAEDLDLHTSDGHIELNDVLAGSCRAHTSDGRIVATDVEATDANLRTSDGNIRGQRIHVTRMESQTSDGSIHLEYAPNAPRDLRVSAVTSDGGITFTPPPGLSAVIRAQTSDGSIQTSLPITVQGRVDKLLEGTIGDGEGMVYLKTHDGSITIR